MVIHIYTHRLTLSNLAVVKFIFPWISHYLVCTSVCVSDGRMRQMGPSLSEGHVTSDEQPPNMALTHPSHTPGSYTGNTQKSAHT